MPMNRVQLQHGMSMPEFFNTYGSEAQCAAALAALRRPLGFRWPRCTGSDHDLVSHVVRKLYQCQDCRHKASLTAGTLMDSTKLPLRIWFLAMYLVSQAKTGLSALALMRDMGTSCRTSWLIQQKLMCAMAKRDSAIPLTGAVQLDDAYLGGARPGVGGRGSPNKVPTVDAVSTNAAGHAMRVELNTVAGFTTKTTTDWAHTNLAPTCNDRGDGLNCYAGVIDAGCAHSYIVVANRKPRDLPRFTWVNTALGNLETMISGAHKSFKFTKYATQYLGACCYRFNRCFNLLLHVNDLTSHAPTFPPVRERVITGLAEVHD